MNKELKRIRKMTKKIWRALTPEERERWRQTGTIDFIFLVREIIGLPKYIFSPDEWEKVYEVIDNAT